MSLPDKWQTHGLQRELGVSDAAEIDESAAWAAATLKARSLLFLTLAILWVFPTSGAIWIIVNHFKDWKADSVREFIGSVAVEDWVAFGLLTCHFLFGVLAIHFRRAANVASRALETRAFSRNNILPT